MKTIELDKAFKFTQWIGENFYKAYGGWMPRYSNQLSGKAKTTQELFDYWKLVIFEPLKGEKK